MLPSVCLVPLGLAVLASIVLISLDAKLKLQIASELRDSIDLYTHATPGEYHKFLQKLMPVFLEILRGPPVFISTLPEQVVATALLRQVCGMC